MEENNELDDGRIRKTPLSWLYTIDYDDYLKDARHYRRDREVFRNATENDTIVLNINNGGGLASTLISLVAGIRSTQAHVVGVLEGEAHSAAGALFLQCHEFQVAPHASMLIHDGSFGSIDNSSKVYSHVEFEKKHNESIFKDLYEDFLTPEEIDNVLRGQDIWLNDKEIVERLKKRAKLWAEREQETQDFCDNLENEIEQSVDDTSEDIVRLSNTCSKKELISVYTWFIQNTPNSKMTKAGLAAELLKDHVIEEIQREIGYLREQK